MLSRRFLRSDNGAHWSTDCGANMSDRSWEKRVAITTLIFDILLFVATCVYVWYAGGQLRAMNGQLEETKALAETAKIQANAAAKQLELSERPWLSAQISVYQPLTIDEKGGRMGIRAMLKNTGHSVALDVRFSGDIITLLTPGLDTITAGYAGLCERLRKRAEGEPSGFSGSILFPGEQLQIGALTDISRENIEAGLKTSQAEGKLSFALITCIDYRFAFAPGHHQTRYVFHLGQPLPTGGFMGFFDPKNLPNDLHLIPSYIGNSAD